MQRCLVLAIIGFVLILSGCSPGDATSSTTSLPGTAAETIPQRLLTTTTMSTATTSIPPTTLPEPETSTTVTATTRPPARVEEVVLQGDGLGVVSFGDPMEVVQAVLVSLFGEPNEINIERDPNGGIMPWGYGADTYFEMNSWKAQQLWIVFSDAEHYKGDYWFGDTEPPSGPILIAYDYSGQEFFTAEGIGIGSTPTEIENAYPSAEFLGDEYPGPVFFVEDGKGLRFSLGGVFHDDGLLDLDDPSTKVAYVGAGALASP